MTQKEIMNSTNTNFQKTNTIDQKFQSHTQTKIVTKGASQMPPNQQLWGPQTQSETLAAEKSMSKNKMGRKLNIDSQNKD